MRCSIALAVLVLFLGRGWAADPARAANPAATAFFEKQIRPLLAEKCYSCHSTKAKKAQGGLALDSRAAIRAGGNSGPVLTPGKPEQSLLIAAVSGTDPDLKMPPKEKLRPQQIALLQKWVRDGAVYPESVKVAATDPNSSEARNFWSFRPLRQQKLPEVRDAKWPRKPIDYFLLSAMERQSIAPSLPADRRTLIRRATFDLIGLPPTPEEVKAFLADNRPDAYPRLVDRLLASPRHGERWARFWLDHARYCDVPESWVAPRGKGWPYRDWVVQAFNRDLPYNQFVLRQLAADQMPNLDPKEQAALGFLGGSPDYWKELQLDVSVIKGIVADEWEERIDTVCSTFLGLTVACARCHDHKFDPITTRDYYGLAGVIAGIRQVDLPLFSKAKAKAIQDAQGEVQAIQERMKQLKAGKSRPFYVRALLGRFQDRIHELQATPGFKDAQVRGITDAQVSVVSHGPNRTRLEFEMGVGHDIAMHTRGNANRPGPVVPRQFLTVLTTGQSKPFTHGSGRLEFARAIVTDGAPLAARVIVNRIWKHHFGRGLVESSSDFGRQGERPSHPELLDDLAARFVAAGWSFKWLHREIMLSAAYRQSSNPEKYRLVSRKVENAPASAVQSSPKRPSSADPRLQDPDNRFYWRMNRRRLEVESWRDAMLAVNGTLESPLGGPPQELTDAKNRRRTIYGLVRRTDLTDLLRLHDFPDPLAHSASRIPTTTPLQQLYTLNGPLLRQEAAHLASRLEKEVPAGGAPRVRRAYALLFNRAPSEKEIELSLGFLGKKPDAAAWSRYAHVLLGSNEFRFID